MKREKEFRKKESEDQLKILSTKLIFVKIQQLTEVSLKEGLTMLNKHRYESKNAHKAIKRVTSFSLRHQTKCKRIAFRKWFNKTFSYDKQNHTISQLVVQKANFKTFSKFFFQWRSAYFDSLKKYDDKMEAITLIKDISNRHEEFLTRRAVCIWKKFSDFETKKRIKIRHLVRRKHGRLLEGAMANWLSAYDKSIKLMKFEALKIGMGQLKMRQKVFYALKLAVQEEKTQRDLEIFYERKNISEVKRKFKFIERSYLLVDKISEENDKFLIIKTFNAFKYNNYLEKYIKAKQNLDQENEKKRD